MAPRASLAHPRLARWIVAGVALLCAPLAALGRGSTVPLVTTSLAAALVVGALVHGERRTRDEAVPAGQREAWTAWPRWHALFLAPLFLMTANIAHWRPPRQIHEAFTVAWNARDHRFLAGLLGPASLGGELSGKEFTSVTSCTVLDGKDPSHEGPNWKTVEFTLADGSGLRVWFREEGRWSARGEHTPRALALQVSDFDAAMEEGELEVLRTFASHELPPGSLERVAAQGLGPFYSHWFRLRGDEAVVQHSDGSEALLESTWHCQLPDGWRLTALGRPE